MALPAIEFASALVFNNICESLDPLDGHIRDGALPFFTCLTAGGALHRCADVI